MKWCPRLIVLVAIGSLLPMLLTVQAQRSKRLVEAVKVVGNRRLSAKDILSHIKTRPGEPFSAKQSLSYFLTTRFQDIVSCAKRVEPLRTLGITNPPCTCTSISTTTVNLSNQWSGMLRPWVLLGAQPNKSLDRSAGRAFL